MALILIVEDDPTIADVVADVIAELIWKDRCQETRGL